MATVEIPTLTDGTPSYTFRTQLEGVDYQFTFRFGERRAAWMFDLATAGGGVQIITGQMVTVGRDLLRRVAIAERPPGRLVALNVAKPDTGGTLALPGLYDLGRGGRTRLYYIESVP